MYDLFTGKKKGEHVDIEKHYGLLVLYVYSRSADDKPITFLSDTGSLDVSICIK